MCPEPWLDVPGAQGLGKVVVSQVADGPGRSVDDGEAGTVPPSDQAGAVTGVITPRTQARAATREAQASYSAAIRKDLPAP